MVGSDPPGVLIIAGPTASGKTEFALALAQRYGAEIVGADSRQIYRDMPIGTAAPTQEQRSRVPHHLVGFVDPYERYSAARYVADASAVISTIRAGGKRVIVAGGTGFYIRALCGGVDLAPAVDPEIRARVEREARLHPLEALHDWLRARDPRRAAHISAGDRYRTMRALEIDLARSSGRAAAPGHARAVSSEPALPTLRAGGIQYRKIALQVQAAELAQRIDERTTAMLADGLIDEAERIGAAAVAADAVGYAEALAYTYGAVTFTELHALLARATRRYAKRQMTWLRSEPDITWIDAGDVDAAAAIAAELGW